MRAYKLKFHSSFHIDAGSSVDGSSEMIIHSDTLFSALVSATRKLYGDEIAEMFLEPGALVLSSAFPYYREELFFPKPLHFFPKDVQEYEMLKVFKKVKFISKDLLDKILVGETIDTKFYSKDYVLDGCWRTIQNYQEKTKTAEDVKLFEVQEVPHVVMDRITNQTQIYYKTEVYFHKNAGLYFIAKVKEELLQKFETVLRFLGDEGIGADRTVGKGFFDVKESQNISLPLQHDSDCYYSLSLYSPTKEEFDKIEPRKSYYDFTIRGGWISNNTLNRKSLRMFIEGSVLKFSTQLKPIGCLHKVLEKKDYEKDLRNDIFRSGQAIFLPIRGGVNGDN